MDRRYRDKGMLDISVIESSLALKTFTNVLSDIKLSSPKQYKQALGAYKLFQNISSDTTEIYNHVGKGEMSRSTNISGSIRELGKVFSNSDFLDSVSETNLEKMAGAFALANRASANIVNVNGRLRKNSNSSETFDKFANRVLWANEALYKHYESKFQDKGIFEFLDDTVQSVNQDLEDLNLDDFLKDMKKEFLFAKLMNITTNVLQSVSELSQNLSKAVGNLAEYSSSIMDFGDILTSPSGFLEKIMSGYTGLLSSMISAGNVMVFGFIEIIMNMILAIFTDLFADEDSEDSRSKSMVKLVSSIVVNIGNIFQGLFSITVNVINMALSAFTSTISSILKIVKRIVETSPVMSAIKTYLELAVTMFFFPFFSAFGDVLMEKIMGVYASIVLAGTSYAFGVDDACDSIEENNESYLKNLLVCVEGIITGVATLIKEVGVKVAQELIAFFVSFIDVLCNNSSLISTMLSKGFDFYTDLVSNGLLKTLVSSGTSVFELVASDADRIYGFFNLIKAFCEFAIAFFNNVLNNLQAWVYSIFGILGGLIGADLGFKIGTVVPAIGNLIGAVAGGAIGLAIGEGLAYTVVTEWIDPIYAEMVPRFAEGGKVKNKYGGRLGIMGEGGEGEYAIPQSKLGLFRGNNNIIVRFNGKVYNPKGLESVLDELRLEDMNVFPTYE